MNDRKTNEPLFYFDEGLQGILDYKPREWIIPGLIPQGACLVGVVGYSGSGKSCVVDDISMNYFTGATEWFNFPMRGDNRNCVLMTSEGDYKRRLKGWLNNRGITTIEEAHTEGRLLILDPSKCHGGINITDHNIAPLIESIKERVPSVGLIVIDTLNGFYTGSENDNSHMADFLRNVDRLSRELEACVIIIHHKGKKKYTADGEEIDSDDTGRGASSFNAKLDMNISISGKPRTGIFIKTTKARDSEEGFCFKLTAKTIPIGHREDGTPETTIVLDSLEPLKELTNEQKTKRNKDIELIQEGITEGLIPVVEDGFITREDLTAYFTTHGGKGGTGFKGARNNGALNQSSPKGTGICGRLLKKEAIEWIEESEGYLLRDTDSYCWKW